MVIVKAGPSCGFARKPNPATAIAVAAINTLRPDACDDMIHLSGRRGVAGDFLHHPGVVEKMLLDQFLAAPGLPRHLLHHAPRSILGGELEPPPDRRVIAVEQWRPQSRGLDACDRGPDKAFLFRP